MSQNGSGVWQELPTQLHDGHLLARIDDAAIPAGAYVLRATALDQAQNQASTTLRTDGQPMALNLPLRTPMVVRAGFETARTVVQLRRKHGKRVRVRHRVTSVDAAARVAPGATIRVSGRLVNAAGQPVSGQSIGVSASSSTTPEHQVGTVQTDGDGRFIYSASGSSSQTLRFGFAGSAVMLPAQTTVTMTVPAATSLTVNRRHLHNGQTVTFTGALRTLPAPPGGKLLELQVRLPKRWETFRTLRTDQVGHWSARYHFTRTYGVQRYRFRAKLPEEAGYPFALGGSPPHDRRRERTLMGNRNERPSIRWLRAHLTYANVMSTLAVCIALGGSSYAAVRINGSSIKNHSYRGGQAQAQLAHGASDPRVTAWACTAGGSSGPTRRVHRR